MVNKCCLVFPNQLFKESKLLKTESHIFLVEEYLFFKQYKFHKQKISFHRATMKFYQDYLKSQDVNVSYINSYDNESNILTLLDTVKSKGFNLIEIYDPVDYLLNRRIKRKCNEHNIDLLVHDSPQFLNSNEDLEDFFKESKKKFFQTSFYKSERKRRSILIDSDGRPEGGEWTYDILNRKKYPKGEIPPKIDIPEENEYISDAQSYTNKNFKENYGKMGLFNYPVTFDESEKWFDDFLENRFMMFGDYEDAIVKEEITLNHSLLSPLMNVGLLSPSHVITKSIDFSVKNNISINSTEGFIRQIIGWREFIRGVYTAKGSYERTLNYWGFERKIPRSFYTGETGIEPIDSSIKKVLKTGYLHHIERLMILGNFMLLCEFDPDEVYKWFMEVFIDSYDWVMVPNVYGMSQFADGGLMSTKPYISSSNYIIKMSNYKKGEWCKVWDALFWNFMDKQRSFFLKNPRMRMLISSFDKMDNTKRENYIISADNYLNKL